MKPVFSNLETGSLIPAHCPVDTKYFSNYQGNSKPEMSSLILIFLKRFSTTVIIRQFLEVGRM